MTDFEREELAHKIATLNDAFRTRGREPGAVVMTRGAQEYGQGVYKLVVEYDDFNPDNDPHMERDFGSFNYSGKTFFWKIDYYADKEMTMGAEPEQAAREGGAYRVLTVMLAEEY